MPKVEAKPTVKQAVPVSQVPRVDDQLMGPGKYEVTPEHVFSVELYLTEKDKRWILAEGKGKGVDSHELVFRIWTYNEMVEVKKMSTHYDPQKRLHMIDNDLQNRLKIQKFLLSWTFDRDNPRLKLHRVNGVLTDESWDVFTRLQTNIITYIIDEMNRVYEYNG